MNTRDTFDNYRSAKQVRTGVRVPASSDQGHPYREIQPAHAHHDRTKFAVRTDDRVDNGGQGEVNFWVPLRNTGIV